MSRRIWLINLFGTPCAPSSFNPDNSLAGLAGCLKAAGYSPLIFDYQTVQFCSELIPPPLGKRALGVMDALQSLGENDHRILREAQNLNEEIWAHQSRVVDALADTLLRRAKSEDPLFIGIKLYSGEGHALSQELVLQLKRRGLKTPLVGGGPLVRVMGADYLRLYPAFDYLLGGEADRSILRFAQFLEGKVDFSQVPGLMALGPQGPTQNPSDLISAIDDLPSACYDEDVYPALYLPGEKARVFQLDDSRGCPNACHFCAHPQMNGRRVRCVSPKDLALEAEVLQKKFGAMAFRFTGSNTPKKFLREFASHVTERGLRIKYSCYGSVNTTHVEQLKALKNSGLTGIFIGMETFDEHVLTKIFNKKQDSEAARELVRASLDSGIYTTTSWIYPAPEQSAAVRSQIIDFLQDAYGGRSTDEGSIMVVPAILIPGTHWWNHPDRFGFKILDRDEGLKAYAGLRISLFSPRRLLKNLHYQVNGMNFLEWTRACDELQGELAARRLPLNITDDWMLMGKLSGLSMDTFRDLSSQCFVSGDYAPMRDLICRINLNSSTGIWEGVPVEHPPSMRPAPPP